MELEASCSRGEEPAALEDYQAFLTMIKKALAEDSTKEWRSKLIGQIIGKIEVGTDKVKIHWRAGQKWIKMGFEDKKRSPNPILKKKWFEDFTEWLGRRVSKPSKMSS